MRINAQGKEYLSQQVSDHEVKNAVFSIKYDKSFGPDGYTAKFFKHHWRKYKELITAAA